MYSKITNPLPLSLSLTPAPHFPKKGSALLISIIFISVIGLLVGSYLKVALNEYKNSQGTFYNGALVNLAEGGLDDAFWAINHKNWDDWTISIDDAIKITENIRLSDSVNASVSLLVLDYQTFPIVISQAEVVLSSGKIYSKQLRAELGHRSIFANGLTAKEKLFFKGNNIMVDSFDSANGGYNYLTNRGDRGTVGSPSVEVDAVDVQNADVYGYVATGNAQPDFGPNARIYGADTPLGVKIDTDRIATDFVADFPLIPAPALSGANTSLPGGAISTIGTPGGAPEYYHLSNINLKKNEELVIDGPVVIIVDQTISVKGQIRLTQTGKAKIYVDGNIDIGGNGVVNETNVASNLIIYGTNGIAYGQDIFMHGNAYLTAAIYAPNANITLRGGGNSGVFFGAAVGTEISMVGNYSFHYDEQLGNFAGDDPFYQLKDWRELHTALHRIDFDSIIAQVSQGLDAVVGFWGDHIVPIPTSMPDYVHVVEEGVFGP